MDAAAVAVWLMVGIAAVGGVIQILTYWKLHVVIKQTNGMSHRLEEWAGLAGEQRGREQEKLEERRDHDA